MSTRKRKIPQCPSEGKNSKIDRPNEVLQMCTMTEAHREGCPIIDTEDNLLQKLVYPHTPKTFMDSIWNKKALAVVNAPESRLEELIGTSLFGLDVSRLIEETSSPQIFAWMKDRNNKISSIELNEEAALRCYECGASLYFRAPPEISSMLIAAVSRSTKMFFASQYSSGELRGEVETFVSRKGNITDWHFDYMHNFTLQLSGAKRWSLSEENAVLNPIRGCTPHYSGIDTMGQQLKVHRLSNPNFNVRSIKNHETVTLTAGSFLYFPPGMWHRVECIEEDSISINISMMPSTWSDLVCDGIRHTMWRSDVLWREAISNLSSVASARARMQNLLQKLKQVVGQMTADDFLVPCMIGTTEPRATVVITDSGDCKNAREDDENDTPPPPEVKKIIIGDETVFRINSLAVLIKETDLIRQTSVSEDVATIAESTSSEDSSDECDSVYRLHVNFGNEQLESTVEIKFVVKRKFETIMDFLAARRCSFVFEDIISRLNQPNSKRESAESNSTMKLPGAAEIKHLLQNMIYYGYLSFQQSNVK